jgi:hypothetical protein
MRLTLCELTLCAWAIADAAPGGGAVLCVSGEDPERLAARGEHAEVPLVEREDIARLVSFGEHNDRGIG